MTDIAAIAEVLTEAQKSALRGVYAWSCPADEDEDMGSEALYSLGLWNPRPKWGEKVITPLGLAVREYLENKKDGR